MNDLSSSKLFSMGYDTNYDLRKTLLQILMGMILLFMGVGILTSSHLKYRFTSSMFGDLPSHLSKSEMIGILGWENPYFTQDSMSHGTFSPSSFILNEMFNVNLENMNSLLDNEIPGLPGLNSNTLPAHSKSTLNYPEQSAPPISVILTQRQLATKQMKGTHQQQKTVSNAQAAPWKNSTISHFGKNTIPAKYIPIYKAAAKKYGVPWNLLAAIHRVETDFNQNLAVSSAGAIGPTQFMTCTWIGWSYPGCNGLGNASVPENILTNPADIKKYGGYGIDANGDGKADPMNVKDAIYSTAHYLAVNGAKNGDYKQAIFAYNHSSNYVQAVMTDASRYVTKTIPVNGHVKGKTQKQ